MGSCIDESCVRKIIKHLTNSPDNFSVLLKNDNGLTMHCYRSDDTSSEVVMEIITKKKCRQICGLDGFMFTIIATGVRYVTVSTECGVKMYNLNY